MRRKLALVYMSRDIPLETTASALSQPRQSMRRKSLTSRMGRVCAAVRAAAATGQPPGRGRDGIVIICLVSIKLYVKWLWNTCTPCHMRHGVFVANVYLYV